MLCTLIPDAEFELVCVEGVIDLGGDTGAIGFGDARVGNDDGIARVTVTVEVSGRSVATCCRVEKTRFCQRALLHAAAPLRRKNLRDSFPRIASSWRVISGRVEAMRR